jgi:hypothetical protein
LSKSTLKVAGRHVTFYYRSKMTNSNTPKKVLIICYSFSGQTSLLLRALQEALEQHGHTVTRERLEPINPLKFPTSGFAACLKLMIVTFFRQRVPIKDISAASKEKHDLIILAGPTWSYNPSGPVLSLIDRDGPAIFNNQQVIPLISCRGYWRVHWFGLRRMLTKCGAKIPNLMVFAHPNKEPWRTIGVFLKIAGKSPERHAFLGKYYTRFGHTRKQQEEAAKFGAVISEALQNNTSLEELKFQR